MANNTGSSKGACASIYFRFGSFLGLFPRRRLISCLLLTKFGTQIEKKTKSTFFQWRSWKRFTIFFQFAQIALKRWFTSEIFAFYWKMGLLNLFSVTDLRPEVKVMYSLRMRTHYRHEGSRKRRVACPK